MKISDLLLEKYPTTKGEEKTGLSFIAEGRMFFGIGEDDLCESVTIYKKN